MSARSTAQRALGNTRERQSHHPIVRGPSLHKKNSRCAADRKENTEKEKKTDSSSRDAEGACPELRKQ